MNNSLFVLLFLMHCHLAKSSIESMASVIRCATGLDYFRMFDTYNSYGCCCCQSHDKCWESSACSWFQKYFGPTYKFKCLDTRGHPMTVKRPSAAEKQQKKRDNGHRSAEDNKDNDLRGVPQCVWEEDVDICAMQLCSCDRTFAECLARLPVPSAKRDCDGQWRPVGEVSPPTEKHQTSGTVKEAPK